VHQWKLYSKASCEGFLTRRGSWVTSAGPLALPASHPARTRCSWLLGGRKPNQSCPCFAADGWKTSFWSPSDLKY